MRSPRDVLAHFGATETNGLSDSQVEALRLKHGRNGTLRSPSANNSKRPLIPRDSHSRRASYSPVGAHPRAVQGPARHHPPSQRRCLVRPRPFRRRGGMDRLCRSRRHPHHPDFERRRWCQPGIVCREGHCGLARVQRKHRQGCAQWNNSICQGRRASAW